MASFLSGLVMPPSQYARPSATPDQKRRQDEHMLAEWQQKAAALSTTGLPSLDKRLFRVEQLKLGQMDSLMLAPISATYRRKLLDIIDNEPMSWHAALCFAVRLFSDNRDLVWVVRFMLARPEVRWTSLSHMIDQIDSGPDGDSPSERTQELLDFTLVLARQRLRPCLWELHAAHETDRQQLDAHWPEIGRVTNEKTVTVSSDAEVLVRPEKAQAPNNTPLECELSFMTAYDNLIIPFRVIIPAGTEVKLGRDDDIYVPSGWRLERTSAPDVSGKLFRCAWD